TATAAPPPQQHQQHPWLSEAATLAPTPAATAPPPPLDAAATPLPAAAPPPPDAAATPLLTAAAPAQLGELPRKAREATKTACTNRFIACSFLSRKRPSDSRHHPWRRPRSSGRNHFPP